MPGYGQTDTISESSYGNMSIRKKFQLKTKNLELPVDRYMHPPMTGVHKNAFKKSPPSKKRNDL